MDNKLIFAKNLKRYMDLKDKSRKDISEALGISYYTVTDWVNGKKYPRMDKVELLADYFGILKSDLIEDKSESQIQMQKKNDTLADIVLRMRSDQVLFEATSKLAQLDNEALVNAVKVLDDADLLKTAALLSELDEDKKAGVKTMLSAFLK